MPIKKAERINNREYEDSGVKKHILINNEVKDLKSRIIVIGVSLGLVGLGCLYLLNEINTIKDGNEVDSIQNSITNLQGRISTLEKDKWSTVFVKYAGGSSTSNNVSRIGERSLGFPSAAKGKTCYIIGEKIRGEGGGSLGGYLGKNDNGTRYQYATMYEAEINNLAEKIEITKNGGNNNSNLTKYDRDNLYISFTMLCH